jgi:hypothetical protein
MCAPRLPPPQAPLDAPRDVGPSGPAGLNRGARLLPQPMSRITADSGCFYGDSLYLGHK